MQSSPMVAVAVLLLALTLPTAAYGAGSHGAGLMGSLKAKASRNLAAAGLPDPMCKTGKISLKLTADEKQACCAGYCGECSDYPSCKSVRGQDSAGACCKSEVLALECGEGAAANVCLKKCSESVPPCIMHSGEVFSVPDTAGSAGDDCTKAVEDWRAKAAAATR
mmetsp:Transcript_97309/g.172257  ORF Transcript_97309/g.172257 Transcript_97309/m.172257 type:complete len:165 (-) Transcript_97309:107-601(-)